MYVCVYVGVLTPCYFLIPMGFIFIERTGSGASLSELPNRCSPLCREPLFLFDFCMPCLERDAFKCFSVSIIFPSVITLLLASNHLICTVPESLPAGWPPRSRRTSKATGLNFFTIGASESVANPIVLPAVPLPGLPCTRKIRYSFFYIYWK